MPINIYLKDEVESTEGFESLEHRSNSGIRSVEGILGKLSIWQRDGRWSYLLAELNLRIPTALLPYVEEIIAIEHFSGSPARESGIYQFEDAEGEWQQPDQAEINGRLFIKGSSIESIRQLYRRFRNGTIRPVESWEAKQQPVLNDDDDDIIS